MTSQDKGRPLPKFGEWDVNNPASAEGFTVIFNKARDDKKTSANPGTVASPRRKAGGSKREDYEYPKRVRTICSFKILRFNLNEIDMNDHAPF
ncbi:RPM1-interacting protein 4 [Acorus calamus]|uniref:RPM1-interacting protein 4 n=1 Tax=Acorus calamus TaxID=4465 RepID=A0AAV9F380_ACOCL|nr:RPM1-interacting protein 4 [Acorus calamus]